MIATIIRGAAVFAAVSTQTAPSPSDRSWLPLGTTLSFEAGDLACEDGTHRGLWRDWRGDWIWGPCVRNR
jgi:hypothetical protein